MGELATTEVNGWKSLTNLSNSCLQGPLFLVLSFSHVSPRFFFSPSPFCPLLLCQKIGDDGAGWLEGNKKLQEFFQKFAFSSNKWLKAGRKRRRESRRENEVLKLLFSLYFSLPLSPPFSKKRNKKRPFIGYVFHFKTQVQRHWEIWALCEGLRVMMRGEEQHPIPNSFLAYFAQNLSKPSAVELGPNPHKSTLAGEKLLPVFKWVKGLLEWRLLADCWVLVAACLAFEQTHKWEVNSSSGFIKIMGIIINTTINYHIQLRQFLFGDINILKFKFFFFKSQKIISQQTHWRNDLIRFPTSLTIGARLKYCTQNERKIHFLGKEKKKHNIIPHSGSIHSLYMQWNMSYVS